MLVKSVDLLNSVKTIQELSDKEETPIGVSLALAIAINTLNPILEVVSKKQAEIVKKYTEEAREEQVEGQEQKVVSHPFKKTKTIIDGEEVESIQEAVDGYNKDITALFAEEIDVPVKPINVSSFPSTYNVPATKLIPLTWLFTQ